MQELKLKLEKIIKDASEAAGYELVDWVFIPGRKGILRVFIDKADGVTIKDCGRFNEYLGSLMDIEDPIAHSYVLEVSSPGVNRQLKTDKDYRLAKNKWVIIITKEEVNGKREFAGNLHEVQDDYIVVQEDDIMCQIKKEQILKARTDTPLFIKH